MIKSLELLPPPIINRVQNLEININQQGDEDLQTAETLLQLHETIGYPEDPAPTSTDNLPDSILDAYENEDILPVNAAPMPDLSKEMQNTQEAEAEDSDSSKDTILYTDPNDKNDKTNDVTTDHSPRGQIKFKHYGIRRNYSSPQSKEKNTTAYIVKCLRVQKEKLTTTTRKLMA